MASKGKSKQSRSPANNLNGQIIISCMKSLNKPATANEIVKEVASRTNSVHSDLRPYIIETLNAGVRFGFLARKSRRYVLDMPPVEDLFEGIEAAASALSLPEPQESCPFPPNEAHTLQSANRMMRKAKIRDRMNVILVQFRKRDISAQSEALINLMQAPRDITLQYKSTAKQRNFRPRTITTEAQPIEVIVISDSSSSSDEEKS